MIAHRKIMVSERLDNQAANRKSMVSDYEIKIVRTIDLDETATSSHNFYIFVSLSNDRLDPLYFTFQYFGHFLSSGFKKLTGLTVLEPRYVFFC